MWGRYHSWLFDSQQISPWGFAMPCGTLCMLWLCLISSVCHTSSSGPYAEACKLLHASGAGV